MIITDRETLKTISRETTSEEVDRMDLVNKLKEANNTAWTNGCGLAAIQIGIPVRFAWLRFKDKELTLLNPKIIFGLGETVCDEGCLSIPNKHYNVKRYLEIEYENAGKRKIAKGFLARIIQHEIDHMNGILVSEIGEEIKE